ncbi:MAG: glycosyltransferase [Bacteroidota bacterium]
MKSFVVRLDKGMYPPHVNFLKEELGFEELVKIDKKKKRLVSKKLSVLETFSFVFFLLQNLHQIRDTHTIVSMGWSSLFLKLLIKLKVIRCQQFFWLGFFIHNYRFFPLLKRIMDWTAIDQEYYIINSEADRPIYHEHLSLPNHKLIVLPYGDFSSADITEDQVKNQVGSYYFAGGFTNRDYGSLIEAFRKLNQKLVIVGSHLNKDLEVELPSNVEVLRDIPKKQFNSLVKNARACILPLREETGASGQMVMLSYMKQGKAVLAPHMRITHEYLEDGHSGLFYHDAVQEIPRIIQYIDKDEDKIVEMGIAANGKYNYDLGGDTIKQKLYSIMTEKVVQRTA